MTILKNEDDNFYTIDESKKIINSYIEASADTLIKELQERQKSNYV